jgi:hypothetical protein
MLIEIVPALLHIIPLCGWFFCGLVIWAGNIWWQERNRLVASQLCCAFSRLRIRCCLRAVANMIITSRSGGVTALGLLENEWTLSDFTARFLEICKRSFARKNRRTLSRVTVSTCKYGPYTLEQALREAFKDNEPLFGGRRLNSQLTKDLKVVIPVVR